MFIIVIVISLEHCTIHSRYWFVQVQVQVLVFCAFYFQEKSLAVLSLVRYAQLHHIAPIAEVGVANYTLSQKRPTFTTCCYFYVHSSIATIFGTNVAEKAGNQNVLYFPTSPK